MGVLASVPALIGAGAGALGGMGALGTGVAGALGAAPGLGTASGLAQSLLNPISPLGATISGNAGGSALMSGLGGALQGAGAGAMVQGSMNGNPLAAAGLVAQRNALMNGAGSTGTSQVPGTPITPGMSSNGLITPLPRPTLLGSAQPQPQQQQQTGARPMLGQQKGSLGLLSKLFGA